MKPPARCIVLIGMMGAGKSSIGRLLHRRTGLDLYDTDDAVSNALGLGIPEIFDQLGEDRFREAEAQAVRLFTPGEPTIVVTGGGVVLRVENRLKLKDLGLVIWLDADDAILFERATRRNDRPLLRGEDPLARLTQLRHERAALYREAADLRIDTSAMSGEEVVDAILQKLEALTNP